MSGSGGGSSGSVNYPSYMKSAHNNWLADGNTDAIAYSIVDYMNFAFSSAAVGAPPYGGSPYTDLIATDPDDTFLKTGSALSSYNSQSPFELLQLMLAETPESLYTTYATDASATEMIDAFTADLDAQYDNTIVPSMAAGYADLNATMSSAYSIGLAGVAAQKTREVAKFTGQIKTQQALQRVQMKMEWRRLLSTLSIENSRIYLAAKHEEDESNADYASKDRLWNLEIFQYGGRLLGSIAGSGGTSIPNNKPSVLGAALSGAAAGGMIGAQVGGPTGAAIGAGIGGAIGVASTL